MNEAAIMVRAILDGRKTQTRRIADISDPFDYPQFNAKVVNFRKKTYWFDCQKSHPNHIVNACPYGIFGNRLWVRETWQHSNYPHGPADQDCAIFYRSDYWNDPHGMDGEKSLEGNYRDWKPSIHMPRWASRINLEITGVRVERLQDISEADAIAEGIEKISAVGDGSGPNKFSIHLDGMWCNAPTAHECYKILWESINGQGSWDKNPWVWVIEFKRIDESVSSC